MYYKISSSQIQLAKMCVTREIIVFINVLVPNQVPAHISENVAAGGDTDEDCILEYAAPVTDTHPHTHTPHTCHLKMLQVHHLAKDPEEEIWHLSNPKHGSLANQNAANTSPDEE